MTLIIGLTGSIGTGKSMIANKLRKMNIPVIDADIIAREVVEQGKPAYENIVTTFGKEVLHEDGTLNREKLGSIVFSNEKKRKQLNEIIHPEIRKEMEAQRQALIAKKERCIVLDIPLLFESNRSYELDKIIVVSTSPETQLKRVLERDQSTKEEALQRINSQIPVEEKERLADAVIDNNGTVEQSKEQLIDILKQWNVYKNNE